MSLPDPTDESLMKFVFGDEVVAAHLREVMSSPVAAPYNAVVSPTNGRLWGRSVLPKRTTVLVNLAILSCLNRPRELHIRITGLLRAGMSVQEIQEVIMHVGFYVGNPAGVEATSALFEAMHDLEERGIEFRQEPAPG